MLTKKKKLSKKEIKQDKLVSLYYKAYGYFNDNKSAMLLYGAVLVVVAVAAYFYINHRAENNQLAGIELGSVMDLYDQGNYLEAIEGKPDQNITGLKDIVEQYGGTENGEVAKIYLANSYNRLQKFDEAYKYYKDYDGSNETFKATALAGQAGYLSMKKEYSKAADLYYDAARVSKTNVENPSYLVQAGINYINAGNNNKAKEVLEKVKKDYEHYPEVAKADKYLAMVD